MLKKFFLIIVLFFSFVSFFNFVSADNIDSDFIRMEVFERDGCAHCKAEKDFLDNLQKNRSDLLITYHNIKYKEHKDHFLQLTELENIPKVTPITIIDGVVLQGFDTKDTTGKKILALINQSKGKKQYTFNEFIDAGGSKKIEGSSAVCSIDEEDVSCGTENINYLISVPFFGPVDVSKYSLPLLSILLGFVDGFNPCAMWVLVMFLTILAEVGSRKKMIQMAGLFILAEAIMYYFILNAWMTTWDFVGMDNIITPVVALVSIGAGSYFLYLFYKKDSTCKVGSLESKRKTSNKIKKYAEKPMTIMVALGILALAFSVNIIEFACSIGIPQTFTKILDINNFGFLKEQIYNAVYIFMYMIDDIVVFLFALYSFDKIGLTTHKYTQVSHFIGGILMLILGLILLLNPTLLIFG